MFIFRGGRVIEFHTSDSSLRALVNSQRRDRIVIVSGVFIIIIIIEHRSANKEGNHGNWKNWAGRYYVTIHMSSMTVCISCMHDFSFGGLEFGVLLRPLLAVENCEAIAFET